METLLIVSTPEAGFDASTDGGKVGTRGGIGRPTTLPHNHGPSNASGVDGFLLDPIPSLVTVMQRNNADHDERVLLPSWIGVGQ